MWQQNAQAETFRAHLLGRIARTTHLNLAGGEKLHRLFEQVDWGGDGRPGASPRSRGRLGQASSPASVRRRWYCHSGMLLERPGGRWHTGLPPCPEMRASTGRPAFPIGTRSRGRGRPATARTLVPRARLTNEKVPAGGDSRNGSDGTRTRDLRRDRPAF